MTSAIFKCPKCNKEITVKFNVGKAPKKVKCPDCKVEMTRLWKNISTGSIVDDSMIEVAQDMLHSGMANGKDKIVY